MKFLIHIVIQFISSFFRVIVGRGCRFHPSCSEYAKEAYDHFNLFQASLVTLKRIFRCHPFSAGGYDPIQRKY